MKPVIEDAEREGDVFLHPSRIGATPRRPFSSSTRGCLHPIYPPVLHRVVSRSSVLVGPLGPFGSFGGLRFGEPVVDQAFRRAFEAAVVVGLTGSLPTPCPWRICLPPSGPPWSRRYFRASAESRAQERRAPRSFSPFPQCSKSPPRAPGDHMIILRAALVRPSVVTTTS